MNALKYQQKFQKKHQNVSGVANIKPVSHNGIDIIKEFESDCISKEFLAVASKLNWHLSTLCAVGDGNKFEAHISKIKNSYLGVGCLLIDNQEFRKFTNCKELVKNAGESLIQLAYDVSYYEVFQDCTCNENAESNLEEFRNILIRLGANIQVLYHDLEKDVENSEYLYNEELGIVLDALNCMAYILQLAAVTYKTILINIGFYGPLITELKVIYFKLICLANELNANCFLVTNKLTREMSEKFCTE